MEGTTNYPFNFVNRRGIPLIESNAVSSDGTNVVITINNGAFRFLNGRGIILFRLNTTIADDYASEDVLLSSNGSTQALTLVGGSGATASQLTGAGVYLIYYDKTSNLLQLLTFGYTETTTESES